jgi:hypothetical protein
MDPKLTIEYDRLGDTLFIDKVKPYAEQESDLIADEVLGRFNPHTGELETLEIMWFMRRLERGERIELPLSATLRWAGEDAEPLPSAGNSAQPEPQDRGGADRRAP